MAEQIDYGKILENLKKTFHGVYGIEWSENKELFTQFGLLYFSIAENHGAAARHNALMDKLDKLSSSVGK